MKKVGYAVAILAAIGLAAFLFLPMIAIPKQSALVALDMCNLRQIGMACRMYAIDHDGQYPPGWSCLTNYAGVPKLYVTRGDREIEGAMSNVMEWTSYIYVRGISTASLPNSIVAFLPPGHHDKRNGGIILFADGSVAWKSLRDFTKTLNSSPTPGRIVLPEAIASGVQ